MVGPVRGVRQVEPKTSFGLGCRLKNVICGERSALAELGEQVAAQKGLGGLFVEHLGLPCV